MFYIVEVKYVGPNPLDAKNIDANKIEIRNLPALSNSSAKVIVDGWCGTTGDFSTYAHGEYESASAAREAITARFGAVRTGNIEECYEMDVLEVYLPGKHVPLSPSATCDWAFDEMQNDISADITDDQIKKLIDLYQNNANSEGCKLHCATLEENMIQHRKELRDERAERLERFKILRDKMMDEFNSYLRSVELGELEDFCCDWALEEFMKDNFGGYSYHNNKEAIEFYHAYACGIRAVFSNKQEQILLSRNNLSLASSQ